LRESPALSIATGLAATGARVQAYDPAYRRRAGEQLDSLVHIVDSAEAAACGADLLLVTTDWAEFAEVDWLEIARVMRGTDVFDGRNCIDRAAVSNAGLACYWVGAGEANRTQPLDLRKTTTIASATKPKWANGHHIRSLLIDGRSYLATLSPEIVQSAGPKRRPAAPSHLYAIAKRTLDVAASFVMLTFAAIVVAVAAIAVRLETGRPIFFRAERVGRNGRTFTMYKFRTMRVDATPFAHKTQDNPAVTRVGRFLRLTCIDELPQLWNVLRGQMSLVGPRPEQPFIVDWYQPWQRERLNVAPGLTGWWQIEARGDGTPMYLHIARDIWYVRHRSFRLDLEILLRTPWVLFRGGVRQ
jgi:lipopolysaccharide/colanic/teichoic acid biosynthesis glycosyltransferase